MFHNGEVNDGQSLRNGELDDTVSTYLSGSHALGFVAVYTLVGNDSGNRVGENDIGKITRSSSSNGKMHATTELKKTRTNREMNQR